MIHYKATDVVWPTTAEASRLPIYGLSEMLLSERMDDSH